MRSKTPQQADKILAAAARLFASHRFHEARMDDIAALAEVGKGTLYRYFKDKEELYLALLARAAEGLQACVAEGLQGVEGARDRLVAIVAALIDYFDDNPHLFEVIQHAEAMQRHDREFPWQKTRHQTLALVLETFEAGSRAGEFHIADPEVAVLMLLGGLRAVIRFSAPPRPAGFAERIVAGFLDGHGPQTCADRDKRGKGAGKSSQAPIAVAAE